MKVAVRGLMAEAGLKVEAGDEAASLHTYLDRVATFAESAGGEPPLPDRPDTAEVRRLRKLSGNELIAEVYERRDALKGCASNWGRASELALSRLAAWARLEELVRFADALPFAAGASEQTEAIRSGRHLLDEPDPIAPIASALCVGLREALLAAHARYEEAFTTGQGQLDADPQWGQTDEPKRADILTRVALNPHLAPVVGTEAELLGALRETTIPEWNDRADAIPAKVALARERAAQELAPKATRYTPPAANLASPDDVQRYVDELREELLRRVDEGPVII